MRSIHHSFGVQTSEWMNLVQSLPCSLSRLPAVVFEILQMSLLSGTPTQCRHSMGNVPQAPRGVIYPSLTVTVMWGTTQMNRVHWLIVTDTQFTFWTSVSQSCTITLVWVLELKTGSWPATQRNTFKAHEFMYVLDGFLYSFHHWKPEMNSRIMHIRSDLLYIYDLFSGGFLAYRDTVDVYEDE